MGKVDSLGSTSERLQRRAMLWAKALYHRSRVREGEPLTVFVAGTQRSGTNMLMDVLERSFETDVYHERDVRAFDNYQMRPLTVIRDLRERCKAKVFVIKALCELQHLSTLIDALAPSKAVWIIRRYEDVVNSMLVSFGNQAYQVKRLAVEPDYHPWLGGGMSRETQDLLARLARGNLDNASAAALLWYLRNVLYFDQRLHRDPRVLLVSYEPLVSAPQEELLRILDFINLRYTSWIGNKISPRSVRRRAAPEIDSGVRGVCDALTHRFEGVLEYSTNAASGNEAQRIPTG